jgi:toxin ParE1/3/4
VKRFSIHAQAEAEVRMAVAYYEGQRRGLGRAFRQEFEKAIARIQRSPQAWSLVDDQGTRKHLLKRFPYTLYYIELDDSIWIAAVAHQKRRPGYWSGRNPPDSGST